MMLTTVSGFCSLREICCDVYVAMEIECLRDKEQDNIISPTTYVL